MNTLNFSNNEGDDEILEEQGQQKSMNGDCFFRILKLLMDVKQMPNYNWCADLLYCPNDTIVEWKKNLSRNFVGPPLIVHESEIELQRKLAHMAQENQAHTKPSTLTHGSSPAPEQPCPQCGSEREASIERPSDPIEVTEEDVYGILALPIGPLEVQVASICELTNEYTKLLQQWRTRDEFIGNRCKDQWFPIVTHWTTDRVEQRNKDERSSMETMEGNIRDDLGRCLYNISTAYGVPRSSNSLNMQTNK
ncbi:hypothetical protein Cgig2_028159 [Carnegiea gigantea]|uniref:Uncharacterized protein n=1 Tax=Carnegiea gigantea TaxID=171969 RepID=A0A9Q1Q9E5_9CARY|nr:hypothetical protein Cgig2_028159 [Carnegiea gigantea]